MTSRDDIEPDAERAIDEFLDAASEALEAEEVTPSPFAAVLERARRLDPGLGRSSPAPRPSPTGPVQTAALMAELAPFVAAARAEAELDVAERQAHPRAGLPARGGARVTRWIAIGGTLAAAAAVLLLWSLLDGQSLLRADTQRDAGQAMDHVDAERRVLEAETGGEALGGPLRRPRRVREGGGPPAEPPAYVLPDEPVPLETLVPPSVIPEEAAPLEPALGEDAPAAAATKRGKAVDADPEQQVLRRLDRAASARLAAGDAEGAEAAYRALVRKGRRSGLVELAYGDLFTLAHRRGDPPAQQALWREYLRKFPRGRFADDARAGLCRHAPGDQARACWDRYLDEFPTGAYHRQAERVRDRE